MWTYHERRNRTTFSSARLACDRTVGPLWGQPDPESGDKEQEDNDGPSE